MDFLCPPIVTWQIISLIPYAIYRYLIALFWYLTPRRFTKRKCIEGQTVLITGAGSGIGRLLAMEFSKHSVTLVMLDLNRSSLLDTEKLLDGKSRAFIYECDVSNREQVYQTARKVKKVVGSVDILINNAGIVTGKKFLDLPDEMIVKTIEVNTLAHFWTLKAFLGDMVERNSGHVVSMSSNAGLHGLPRLADYCASKFAAAGLMEALKVELLADGKTGVRTTTVCPLVTSTGLFAGSRKTLAVMLKPEYVAKEVMAAILADEEILILPRWTFIVLLLRWTMPELVVKAFYKSSGILNFMDTFTGRMSDKENGDLVAKDASSGSS